MADTIQALPTPTTTDLKRLEGYSRSVRVRALVEMAVVRRMLQVLIAKGYDITVDDGGADAPVKRSQDVDALIDTVFAVDEVVLYVHYLRERAFAWISLDMGNDGWDVISDYSVNLEEVLAPVNDYAEQMSEWL